MHKAEPRIAWAFLMSFPRETGLVLGVSAILVGHMVTCDTNTQLTTSIDSEYGPPDLHSCLYFWVVVTPKITLATGVIARFSVVFCCIRHETSQ